MRASGTVMGSVLGGGCGPGAPGLAPPSGSFEKANLFQKPIKCRDDKLPVREAEAEKEERMGPMEWIAAGLLAVVLAKRLRPVRATAARSSAYRYGRQARP